MLSKRTVMIWGWGSWIFTLKAPHFILIPTSCTGVWLDVRYTWESPKQLENNGNY